jgi:superfamily I DNA/RNA helicase
MVDEGHDFQPEWLKLVAQMVDPTTNSLLVLYDDAQSIYDKKKKAKFTFSSLGIQAKGRTTILRLNYRNTAEVLAVAYEFAKDFITTDEAEEDGIPLIQPQSAGRRGRAPILAQLQTLKQEMDYLAKELKALNEEGRPWKDMAVVYRQGFVGKEATERLRALGLPVEWISEGRAAKYDPSADSVKIVTMHGSKGLEFPVVAIPGLGYMPNKDQDAKEEARLLYVAMTRAMDTLLMTCHKPTPFVTRIKQAQADLVSASQ